MYYFKESSHSAVIANAYPIARRTKKALMPAIFATFLGANAFAGQAMMSNSHFALRAGVAGINGAAVHGAYVKLVTACYPGHERACTWHWVNGMIVNDENPSLAMNAYGGAAHGSYIRLVNNCSPANPDCTWHYHNGMIVSDKQPNLAINAYGGARAGTDLRLHEACTSANPDCTFSWGLLTK